MEYEEWKFEREIITFMERNVLTRHNPRGMSCSHFPLFLNCNCMLGNVTVERGINLTIISLPLTLLSDMTLHYYNCISFHIRSWENYVMFLNVIHSVHINNFPVVSSERCFHPVIISRLLLYSKSTSVKYFL